MGSAGLRLRSAARIGQRVRPQKPTVPTQPECWAGGGRGEQTSSVIPETQELK